jgi:glutamate 2,3-aminomutase
MNNEKKKTKQKEDRFSYLRKEIRDYAEVKDDILTGIDRKDMLSTQKKKILTFLKATETDWSDYRWQLKNRFTDAVKIAKIIGISPKEAGEIMKIGETYRYAVSPYYLSLIDPDNPACPIKRQSIPCLMETSEEGESDPMDEAGWTPEEYITRRYPDRLIIKVTNQCGMYCRFCQRRRRIGEKDTHVGITRIRKAIQYVKEEKEIRDVLITGGDAFMLSDSDIEMILSELRSIPHVEIIRFGTRTPVTLPQRITPALVDIFKKYHPVYVNTHFNSPAEITEESKAACERMANAGIPLGNQMVLLNGVNNDKFIVRKLNQELLKIRVKPYYIFHPKAVIGTSHFWVRIEEGLEIIESLRGRTSGMAIPTYIVNGSKGLGKTPIMPNYLLYIGKDCAEFRNWRGETFSIRNDFSQDEKF